MVAPTIFWRLRGVYEERQRVVVVQATTLEGVAKRKYPLTESAAGLLEDITVRDVGMLMNSDALWQCVMSGRDLNRGMRGLAFRMLSCLECLVHSTLQTQHQLHPIATFKALGSHVEARNISEKKE